MGQRQYRHSLEPVRELVFVLTEKCNLNCVYCYEEFKNKSKKTLPANFVIEKIREEMLADNGFKKLWFIFFGGEPLLAFDTIREVVEWFESISWPAPAKEYHFMVETNGTLLNDGMKRWFAARRELLTLSVSLDGTKAAHDRNRSGSYNAVAQHFDFLRQTWPKQAVKMTIGPETIDQTYEGVLHVYSLGLQAEFDIVFEDVWGDAESERRFVGIWMEHLEKLVAFYGAHPELPRPLVLRRKLERLFAPQSLGNYTFCGAGKYVRGFTPDGVEYPCFRFAPYVVGKPLLDVWAAPDSENEQCALCPFVGICTTCEGHNYAVKGSCFHRTSFHCKFFMASLLATAKMLLIDHPDDLSVSAEHLSQDERVQRLRRLLAIRVVDDVCPPAIGLDFAASRAEISF
jgi:uncharacterized protein